MWLANGGLWLILRSAILVVAKQAHEQYRKQDYSDEEREAADNLAASVLNLHVHQCDIGENWCSRRSEADDKVDDRNVAEGSFQSLGLNNACT